MSLFRKNKLKTERRRSLRKGVGLSVQQLDERKLMAADFGGFADFYGPRLPTTNPVAQVSGATTSQLANSDFVTIKTGISVDLSIDNGSLSVTGTSFHDDVNLSINEQTGDLEIEAYSYNNDGILMGTAKGALPASSVNKVDAVLNGGNDILNTDIEYIPVFAEGGSGNDTLIGSQSNDVLEGGDGNDTINGRYGNDIIKGGRHEDTIFGGLGRDIINGGSHDDVIWGQGNGDTIRGGDGDDTIRGGTGDDDIWGDRGHDKLYGNAGEDTIYGGIGNDLIGGGANDDDIRGDSGHDTIHGNSGNDTLRGGSGDDFLYGGDNNDSLFGNSGTDELRGGNHDDYLSGGDDGKKDRLFGQGGRDTFAKHKGIWSDDPDVREDYELYVDKVKAWQWWQSAE